MLPTDPSPAPGAPPSADRRRATPGPPAQPLDLGPGVGELALRPHERCVVGLGDPLRPLDECDVLAHAQPVAARPVELAPGALELGPQALDLGLASCRPGHLHPRDQGHGSTASNSAWTSSSTASAIAWPTRASAASENRALMNVPASPIRADMVQLHLPHRARPELHVV